MSWGPRETWLPRNRQQGPSWEPGRPAPCGAGSQRPAWWAQREPQDEKQVCVSPVTFSSTPWCSRTFPFRSSLGNGTCGYCLISLIFPVQLLKVCFFSLATHSFLQRVPPSLQLPEFGNILEVQLFVSEMWAHVLLAAARGGAQGSRAPSPAASPACFFLPLSFLLVTPLLQTAAFSAACTASFSWESRFSEPFWRR